MNSVLDQFLAAGVTVRLEPLGGLQAHPEVAVSPQLRVLASEHRAHLIAELRTCKADAADLANLVKELAGETSSVDADLAKELECRLKRLIRTNLQDAHRAIATAWAAAVECRVPDLPKRDAPPQTRCDVCSEWTERRRRRCPECSHNACLETCWLTFAGICRGCAPAYRLYSMGTGKASKTHDTSIDGNPTLASSTQPLESPT